jgi:hypothetical protein
MSGPHRVEDNKVAYTHGGLGFSADAQQPQPQTATRTTQHTPKARAFLISLFPYFLISSLPHCLVTLLPYCLITSLQRTCMSATAIRGRPPGYFTHIPITTPIVFALGNYYA